MKKLEDKVVALEKRVKKLEEIVSPTVRSDELLESAKKLVRGHKYASASLLQRRLSIGYARAARILDQLENLGIIGPGEGAKPRKVLNTKSTGEIFVDALKRASLKSD